MALQECTEELVKAHFSQWGHVLGEQLPSPPSCRAVALLCAGGNAGTTIQSSASQPTPTTCLPPPPPLPRADVYFPKRKDTFRRRPFCFVTFNRLEDAQRALAESPMAICGIPIKQLNLVEERADYYRHRHHAEQGALVQALQSLALLGGGPGVGTGALPPSSAQLGNLAALLALERGQTVTAVQQQHHQQVGPGVLLLHLWPVAFGDVCWLGRQCSHAAAAAMLAAGVPGAAPSHAAAAARRSAGLPARQDLAGLCFPARLHSGR